MNGLLSEVMAEVQTRQEAQVQQEFIECMSDVVTGIARASRAGHRTVRIELRDVIWKVRGGRRGYGYISYPNHLPDVIAHCAASGWTVTPLPQSWWDRFLGRPQGWTVEVQP